MKKAVTTRYRSVAVDPDHPLSQEVSKCGRYGKVYEHRLVLYNKIGDGKHQCNWCKKTLSWDGEEEARIVADHLDGNEWNNTPNNLVPSCWRCNFARATRPDFLTHCEHGHEWTEENTYIRLDGTGRQCKECGRRRSNEKYHRKRSEVGYARRKTWREIIPERELYEAIEEGLTIEEMTVAFETCTYTVYKAMKGYGIR